MKGLGTRAAEASGNHHSFSFTCTQLVLPKRGSAEETTEAHRFHGRTRNEHQRALLLQAFVQDIHRPEVQGRWILLIRDRGLAEQCCDLDLGLAEYDPRLLFPRCLCLTR